MNLLLYVEVSPAVPFAYQNSMFQKAKTHLPGILAYDCDNHSEPATVRHAVELLSQADKAVVVVKAGEGSLGSLRPVFEKLWRAAGHLGVGGGGNPAGAKMLSLLPPGKVLEGTGDEHFDLIGEYFSG